MKDILMKDVLDMHTHTLASGHAFSTIREMTRAAADKGLELLGITEHAPRMPGSCHEFYFSNLKILDRSAYDVPVLFGVELNILDKEGHIDLAERHLRELDYGIASLHPPCIPFMSEADMTAAVILAMQNPYVQIIGHPDDSRFPLNYDEVVAAAKECGAMLEINNASLSPTGFRVGARENYFRMLEYCKKYKCPVIVSSDAHVDTLVGEHGYASALLAECDFPQELVVNTSTDCFFAALQRAKNNA